MVNHANVPTPLEGSAYQVRVDLVVSVGNER